MYQMGRSNGSYDRADLIGICNIEGETAYPVVNAGCVSVDSPDNDIAIPFASCESGNEMSTDKSVTAGDSGFATLRGCRRPSQFILDTFEVGVDHLANHFL